MTRTVRIVPRMAIAVLLFSAGCNSTRAPGTELSYGTVIGGNVVRTMDDSLGVACYQLTLEYNTLSCVKVR
jgi:hypothetical protein